MKTKIRLLHLFFFLLTFAVALAFAEEAASEPGLEAEAEQMDQVTLSQGQEHVVQKIASDYQDFLEPNDAEEVVTGLRTGTEFQYNNETYTPPTGKMGYGNVYISLGLAQQTGDLNQVLQMRSEGKGWGEIAHELDLSVGEVMSGMKSANQQLAVEPPVTTVTGTEGSPSSEAGVSEGATSATTTGTSGHGRGKALGQGIISGDGAPIGNNQDNTGKNQAGKVDKGSSSHKYGQGIVSGTGAPISSSGISKGKGHSYGKGIVTGGGNTAGAIHGGEKSSKGLAKGHEK